MRYYTDSLPLVPSLFEDRYVAGIELESIKTDDDLTHLPYKVLKQFYDFGPRYPESFTVISQELTRRAIIRTHGNVPDLEHQVALYDASEPEYGSGSPPEQRVAIHDDFSEMVPSEYTWPPWLSRHWSSGSNAPSYLSGTLHEEDWQAVSGTIVLHDVSFVSMSGSYPVSGTTEVVERPYPMLD